jgi:hypothetical protein
MVIINWKVSHGCILFSFFLGWIYMDEHALAEGM